MYSIPTDMLAAVALAVAAEKARYYLQGVFIEATPSHITMTATNGDILLTAHHAIEAQDATTFSIIIPSETIALALKAKAPELTLAVDGDGYKLGQISFKPIDGTFPDYRRVIPKAIPENPSVDGTWFQSVYLSAFTKAAKLLVRGMSSLGNTNIDGFVIYPDSLSPALVQFVGRDDVFGVAMPYRASRTGFSKPAWASVQS